MLDPFFMWYVYVLESQSDGSYYKGSTNDLPRRLKEHNNGEEKYTRHLVPWKIVWYSVTNASVADIDY